MEVHLHQDAGYRNDLTVMIARAEIETALLHIAHRDRLMELPGLTRHREPTAGEREENRKCKVPVEEHLWGLGLLDGAGKPLRRVIAVGNRNLGNNHGFVAWQHDQTPRLFHVQGDPLAYPTYSCLVAGPGGGLTIEDLRFDPLGARVYRAADGCDLTDSVAWATFGQRVLRTGRVVSVADIVEQFYDIRHVLAYDVRRPDGKRVEEAVFQGYPERFREQALRALWEHGVPRNRYLHNSIGLSRDTVILLQREGTPEEIGHWLREAGAEDGILLDNGGSVACWGSWVYPSGGIVFAAPDYRPLATSVLAFVLKGPVRADLPGGSVSFTVV